MNTMQIMKQAQALQKKIEEIQAQAAHEVVEAAAGGGMVKVKMNGKQEMLAIEIEPEIVDPQDIEMLQTLIMAATNEAYKKSKELLEDKMKGVAGGLNLPGMF